ncbi:hypothetical protein K1W69_10070 [Hoeflea sp. WL0058]|uniref:Uncharacterized protein n=1 Tax=Flavimaribacter sediminis TaxID=2865987 RepID=A0AAE2ZIW9_9HYPH|nr:hypothetical protein [Flavimaribacter sediminis]MBW8637534.1 hypothetical protein [Flavimaribacter sediminis]
MGRYLTRNGFYRYASTLIIAGFAMLCQPISHEIFVYGFPVLLSGVVLFLILDHLPGETVKEEENGV